MEYSLMHGCGRVAEVSAAQEPPIPVVSVRPFTTPHSDRTQYW